MFRMSYTPVSIEAAINAAVKAGTVPYGPEFVDAKGLKAISGISRSHGYP